MDIDDESIYMSKDESSMYFIDELIKTDEEYRDQLILNRINNKGIIQKRKIMFDVHFKYYDYFLDLISYIHTLDDEVILLYLVKGSEAWYYNIKNLVSKNKTNNDDLSEDLMKFDENITQTDVISYLPQNWDIDVFTTKDDVEDVIRKIYVKLRDLNYLRTTQRRTRSGGQVLNSTIEVSNNIKITDEEGQLKSIKLGYPILYEGQTKGYYIRLCVPREQITNVDINEYVDHALCPSNRGVMFIYVKVHIVPNIYHFSEYYTDNLRQLNSIIHNGKKYEYYILNIYGLYYYQSLIKSSSKFRSDKVINIDKSREKILNNILLPSLGSKLSKISVRLYNIIRESYTLKLDYSSLFDVYSRSNIMNKLLKNILETTYINGNNWIYIIDKKTIEVLRPIINGVIIDILDTLKSKNIDGAVVGGDAFERYITTGHSVDIDFKIFTKSDDEYDLVTTFLPKMISGHVLYLNYLFSDYENEYIPRPKFRLRNINMMDKHGYNLFSIDMKTEIPFKNKIYLYENPILDIVIVKQLIEKTSFEEMKISHISAMDRYYKIHTDNTIQNIYLNEKNINIVSKKFLLNDIRNMYENIDKLTSRYNAGKINKDIDRYIKLLNYQPDKKKKGQNIVDINYLHNFLEKSIENMPFQKLYNNMFMELIMKNKEIQKYKTKIPFNINQFWNDNITFDMFGQYYRKFGKNKQERTKNYINYIDTFRKKYESLKDKFNSFTNPKQTPVSMRRNDIIDTRCEADTIIKYIDCQIEKYIALKNLSKQYPEIQQIRQDMIDIKNDIDMESNYLDNMTSNDDFLKTCQIFQKYNDNIESNQNIVNFLNKCAITFNQDQHAVRI